MKNTWNEMNKHLQRINSRVDESENQTRYLEDMEAENTQSEQKKENWIQKSICIILRRINEENIKSLWDNFKHSNIDIMGVLAREKREQGTENLCEK